MTLLNSLSRPFTRLLASPKLDNYMTKVSHPSHENMTSIWTTESSVIAGRSAFAWLRNGFLEFQERFLEEIVVAAVWIKGVTWMEKLFDKFYRGNYDSRLAWKNAKDLKKTVELTALERYTKGVGEIAKTVQFKGWRLSFSLLSAIGIIGVLIPWLNQVKTDWIIKKFYSGKEGHGAHGVKPAEAVSAANKAASGPSAAEQKQLEELIRMLSAEEPAPKQAPQPVQAQQATQAPQPMQPVPVFHNLSYSQNIPAPLPLPYPTYPLAASVPAFSPAPAYNQAYNYPYAANPYANNYANAAYPYIPAPRFAGSSNNPKFAGMGQLLQSFGHFVQDTDVGKLLILDIPLTGGRAVTYAKRSWYESAEVVFRDGVSIYFYFLAQPHVMKIMSKLMTPMLKTSIDLDPSIAAKLQEQVLSRLPKDANLSLAQVRQTMYGSENTVLDEQVAALQKQVRSAGKNNLMPLLEKEIAHYLPEAPQTKAGLEGIQAFLKDVTHVSADEVGPLLEAIENGRGSFNTLATDARQNLTTALKQAFRHSAGVTKTQLMTFLKQEGVLERLSQAEQEALASRIANVAGQDSADLLNSLFRNVMNKVRDVAPENAKVLARAEAFSHWLEEASIRKVSFAQLIREEAAELIPAIQKLSGDVLADEPGLKALEKLTQGEPATRTSLVRLKRSLRLSGNKKAKALADKVAALQMLLDKGTGSLEEMAGRQITRQLHGLKTAATENKASAVASDLIAHYTQAASELLTPGQKRIFSLLRLPDNNVLPVELQSKLHEMLKGGVVHNQAFFRNALKSVGWLPHDARGLIDPGKSRNAQQGIAHYSQILIEQVSEAYRKEGASVMSREAVENLFKKFLLKSKGSRYVAITASMGAAMLGLGVLVPKAMMLMTRMLTGKNEHPGIAVQKSAHGMDSAPSAETSTGSPSYTPAYSQSARPNFAAFAR